LETRYDSVVDEPQLIHNSLVTKGSTLVTYGVNPPTSPSHHLSNTTYLSFKWVHIIGELVGNVSGCYVDRSEGKAHLVASRYVLLCGWFRDPPWNLAMRQEYNGKCFPVQTPSILCVLWLLVGAGLLWA
jgi:hypothetical protein